MQFEDYRECVEACKFGKRLPTALYIHVDAQKNLPAPLRKFLRTAVKAAGIKESSFNLLKLSTNDFKVSLYYPAFMEYPYPALHTSYTLDLEKKTRRQANYADSENPSILHRRELFVGPDHPKAEDFSSFTREGERLGAYRNTRGIGTRQGWDSTLRRLGYRGR